MHAVHAGLHARGARCLERIDRVVEPHVDARRPAGARGAGRSPRPAGSGRRTPASAPRCTMCRIRSCPGWSAGCALPAKRNSTGRSRVARRSARSAVEVVEQQRRALVGGEAPREADGEHVRDWPDRRSAAAGRGAPRCRGCASAARAMRWRTRCSICDFRYWRTLQNMCVGDARAPAPSTPGSVTRCVQSTPRKRSNTSSHSGREEGRHVHAVGDVADAGFSAGSICGQRSRSMRADTPPWMRDTPLWKREPRMASAVMLNSATARACAERQQRRRG